jgi:hypothetical protein
MRGSLVRRIGGPVLVAAALAGAAAAPASAAIGPACSTRVVAAPAGTAATCSFDTQYDYATIGVVVDGEVTVTLRCNGQYGYNYVVSRTFTKNGTWTSYTPGNCQMVVTSNVSGTTANATATPTLPPIYPDPGPVV